MATSKHPKWLHFFGSLKAAVLIIFFLAVVLSIGTFFESYYSRAYAYNLVYGALWFHILLLFLGVNILAAALVRLPPKKRLAGFYISHIGLLLLLAGSLLTLIFGVDGTITLIPGQNNQTVRLEEPVLYIAPNQQSKHVQFSLPKSVFPKNLQKDLKHDELPGTSVRLKRYLPYAKKEISYERFQDVQASGIEFTLIAPQVSQQGVLSAPPSQFPQNLDLGPLQIHFLGGLPQNCSMPKNPSSDSWFLVHPKGCTFFSISKSGLTKLKDENIAFEKIDLIENETVFRMETSQYSALFIPAMSPWPIREKMIPGPQPDIAPDFTSPFQIYSTAELFSGNQLHFFHQNDAMFVHVRNPPEEFRTEKIGLGNDQVLKLPWMKLQLIVEKWQDGMPYPTFVPIDPTPGDEDRISAAAIEAQGHHYWLESKGAIQPIPLSETIVADAFLGFRTFPLPWKFQLERFKMDNDPGTRNPASYESFVNVQTPGFQNMENAHIYMNNPLKKGKYTFYQASYFQMGPNAEGQEVYGSVLQVNYDPGRVLKYAGSLVLVLGTTIHFYIRRSRRVQTANA